MIETHTLKKLEFDKLVEELGTLAHSSFGLRLCHDISFAYDLDLATQQMQETTFAVDYLLQKGTPPLHGLHDIRPSLQRSRRGSVMTCAQLLHIASFLRAVRRLHSLGLSEEEHQSTYLAYMRALQPNDSLESRLSKAIIGEEEVADQASPTLGQIRHKMRQVQEQIRQILDRYLRSHGRSLRESLITMRGNRYVIPVKDTHRQDIPGIIHDTSGSGQTLFVEPLEVVEANNKIRELEAAEREEIERILTVLTAAVVEFADELDLNQDLLAKIDFVTAKARLSIKYKCQPPRINNKGILRLVHARHPFLNPKTAVPISFSLGGSCRILLITGPNTGGKTVALKTCGLFTLMAMAGLHVPASENTELSLFRQVLVDIGDEQSIEANLSTFSSHMKHLIAMEEQADRETLILSDELGSGTDPLEGAALARVILDSWRAKGSLTMATTHYRELKEYALTTDGVENASCAFDEESLQPTYRILMGAVGVSHAFAITEKLGLSPSLISKAKSLLSAEDRQFEELMQGLTAEKEKLSLMLAEAEREKREANLIYQEAKALQVRLTEQKQNILRRAREEARDRYAQGIRELDQLLKGLRSGHFADAKTWQGQRSRLGSTLHEIENEIGAETLAKLKEGEMQVELVVGRQYFAPTLQLVAKLLSLPDAKGQCKIAAGSLQISVPAVSLQNPPKELASKQNLQSKSEFYRQKEKSLKTKGGSGAGVPSKSMSFELMLLGETTLDAVEHLDKYIDQAQVVGIKEIRIVHGKGTGALRQAVHKALRKDKRIADFRLGGYGEGDAGVTIASLK